MEAPEPTGQYARRAGFFYEYLTGLALNFPGVIAGNYVDALDGAAYLTAPRPINNPRWRVRDNLPGSRAFCPIVLRTERVQQAERYDCTQRLAGASGGVRQRPVQRSAVWLTVRRPRPASRIDTRKSRPTASAVSRP